MKFCIVDISNLVHRSKHAVGKAKAHVTAYDPFGDSIADTADDIRVGLILNVVFSGIMSAFQKFQADHIVAAFDQRSWRRDFYEDYKANRREKEKTPDEEADHEMITLVIDRVRDFLRDYTNVTVLEATGAEADDFIARWVQVHDDPVFEHVIVSADGDFKQLVSPTVELYNPMSNTLYTMEGVFHQDSRKAKKTDLQVERCGQKWRVKYDKKGDPETFDPLWELFEKCIRGDTSDNIRSAWPGVRTTKIRKAYDGGVKEYNDFINSTWGDDNNKHSVKDLFNRNRILIDLTAQPTEVIDTMDAAIADALDMERAKLIGAYFVSFCSEYKMNKLAQQAERFTEILSKGYPG